jgi:hypothetical protein
MRLTQSVLSTSGDCQLRAQYTLEPPAWVRRTAGSTRALGTAFHAALEHFYTERFADPPLWVLVAGGTRVFDRSCEIDLYDNTPVEVFNWDAKVPDRETAISYLSAMLAEYLPHAWPTDWTVLAVEHNEWFDDPDVGENVQTKLGCDLVLLDPNDFVVAVDFKTAGKAWPEHKEHPRKNTQAPFYMRNLRRAFPGHAGYRFVFDIVTYGGPRSAPKFERRISDPTPLHEEAVRIRARNFVFAYETVHVKAGMDMPANPASNLCSPKFCDYFDGCPFGTALEGAA